RESLRCWPPSSTPVDPNALDLRSFFIRSLHYLNGGALSPFPAEAGHKRQTTTPNENSSVHHRCCWAAISLYSNFWSFSEQKSQTQRPKSFWEATHGCATCPA